jgi:hypothetical protein
MIVGNGEAGVDVAGYRGFLMAWFEGRGGVLVGM